MNEFWPTPYKNEMSLQIICSSIKKNCYEFVGLSHNGANMKLISQLYGCRLSVTKGLFFLPSSLSSPTPWQGLTHPHPLDPLSPAETTAVQVSMLSSPLVPAHLLHIHYIGLVEPDQSEIISYGYGTTTSSSVLSRHAFVIARNGGESHTLLVDINDRTSPCVISHAIHHGPRFPRIMVEHEIAAMAW